MNTRSPGRLERALPWGLLALVAAFGLRRLDDTDTWWHLASGSWIAQHLAVQRTDVFSFTVPGHEWINLQWLFDLLLHVVFRLGGADGLVLLSAAVYTATFALLLLNLDCKVHPRGAVLIGLVVAFIAQQRFAIRPEMFSFLLLQATIFALRSGRHDQGRSYWLLPPLIVAWVNLHSLFVIGLFLIGCQVASALAAVYLPLPPSWRRGSALDPRALRRLLPAAGVAVAGSLLNPYLLRGALFPLQLTSRFDESSVYHTISEFRTPFFAAFPNVSIGVFQLWFAFTAVTALGALGVSWLARGARGATEAPAGVSEPRAAAVDLAGVLTWIGLAYLGLQARRNMALFALGTAPFLAAWLRLVAHRRSAQLPIWARTVGRALAPVLTGGLVVAALLVVSNEYYRLDSKSHEFGTGMLAARFPVRAVDFFEEQRLPAPLYNDISTGGYLTWRKPTPDGVFVDGRLEVYDEFFATYLRGLQDPAEWSAQAERYGINSVMLFHRYRNRHALIRWLQREPAWSLVYYDDVVVLFVRTAGFEQLVLRAREAFPPWDAETRRRLDRPPDGWGYPRGWVLSLTKYAGAMELLGDLDSAAVHFRQSLDYRLPRRQALTYNLWLARYHLHRRQPEQARPYLERALRMDPGNDSVRDELDRLTGGR